MLNTIYNALSIYTSLLKCALTQDLKTRETGFYDFMKTSIIEIALLSSVGFISLAKRTFKMPSSEERKNTHKCMCACVCECVFCACMCVHVLCVAKPEYVHVSICDVRAKEVCIYLFVSMFIYSAR